jgi:signal transduction histidine kinase/CheY-like chemotaxis protein
MTDIARARWPASLPSGTSSDMMARAVADYDWAQGPLGPIESWPDAVRLAMSLCLGSTVPTAVYIGEDLRLLYNDAWIPVPADRHPWALGRPAAEVWSDIWPIVGPQLEAVMATGQGFATYDAALPMVRDGLVHETYWNYSFTPILDGNGRVVGVFNQGHETTHLVLARRDQAFHLDLEARLRGLVDPTQILKLVAEQLGTQLGANRVGYAEIDAGANITRVDADWTSGLPSLVGEAQNLNGFGSDIVRLLRMGRTLVVETISNDPVTPDEAARSSWREIGIEAAVVVPLVKQGQLLAFLYVHQAVPRRWTSAEIALAEALAERTWAALEQARAEEQLRCSRARLAAESALLSTLIENLPVGVIVVDEAGETLLCNPFYRALIPEGVIPSRQPDSAERWLGYDENGRRIERDAFVGRRALRGETVRDALFRYRTPADQEIWLRISGIPLRGPSGDISGALCVVVDVDDHKRAEERARELSQTLEQRVSERTAELLRAEEALRQSQKLEAMGQITGGVAHDFNNLLTPIIGSLDMLHRKRIGGEREQRLVDGALQSAERARILVQRLLAFARRQPLLPTAVDVEASISGMAELIRSTSGPRVRVEIDVSPELPTVRADANQLEMAVLNLAVNARDAMPEGGTLTIRARLDELGTGNLPHVAPGTYMRLSVADTGIGMDSATLARAVEPFFSTKGVGRGTGLGLSMVQGLASQLQGGFALNSRVGLGTEVSIWLPLSGEKATASLNDPESTVTIPTMGTVLLVDDDALARSSTADMLLDEGYKVIEAVSAEQATKLIADGLVPDLLVTDHIMPGASGTDLAYRLRAQFPKLPIVIISGYTEVEFVAPDLPRLAKPFRQAELTALLTTLAIPAPGASAAP